MNRGDIVTIRLEYDVPEIGALAGDILSFHPDGDLIISRIVNHRSAAWDLIRPHLHPSHRSIAAMFESIARAQDPEQLRPSTAEADAENVERLLADLDAPGPQEPSMWSKYLYDRVNKSQRVRNFYGAERIRAKHNAWERSRPVACICCQREYIRKRIDQRNCQDCIDARKRKR